MNVNSIFPTPTKMSTNTSSTSSSASTGSSSGVDSTFMSLLLTELQSQDPTAPMDTTAMVGQMVSLNQLDQLMSINSTLQTLAGVTPGKTQSTPGVNG